MQRLALVARSGASYGVRMLLYEVYGRFGDRNAASLFLIELRNGGARAGLRVGRYQDDVWVGLYFYHQSLRTWAFRASPPQPVARRRLWFTDPGKFALELWEVDVLQQVFLPLPGRHWRDQEYWVCRYIVFLERVGENLFVVQQPQ